jgi:hypothetical protein
LILPVRYSRKKLFFALTEIFKSYDCLFGFSGSLGGEAEINFLKKKYKAAVIRIPR